MNPLLATALALAVQAGATATNQMLARRGVAAMTPEELADYERMLRRQVAAESRAVADEIDRVNALHPIGSATAEDDGA